MDLLGHGFCVTQGASLVLSRGPTSWEAKPAMSDQVQDPAGLGGAEVHGALRLSKSPRHSGALRSGAQVSTAVIIPQDLLRELIKIAE